MCNTDQQCLMLCVNSSPSVRLYLHLKAAMPTVVNSGALATELPSASAIHLHTSKTTTLLGSSNCINLSRLRCCSTLCVMNKLEKPTTQHSEQM